MSLIDFFKQFGIHFPSTSEDKMTFGLALGGGAARGLAHIGVIQYLEEQGLRANEVSGTSMGAIIAALYATGKTSIEIVELVRSIKFRTLIDPSLQTGLIKGEKIKKYFEDIFGEVLIEDAEILLRIIATDIDSGKKKVFESGKIVDAIRASIGIPGIFQPYEIANSRYVDGGLTENIPASVLKTQNIIAVSALRDISRPIKQRGKILGIEYENHLATSYTIMQKSIDILLAQNEEKSLHNSEKNIILIRPKFPKIDYYEFDRFDEIIKVGYKEAKKVLHSNT